MPIADLTPPDYNTAVGQVRLLIPDVEQLGDLANPVAPVAYIFSDAQIQAFLSIAKNNIKRAAAEAKMVLATSETLIQKVIKAADLSTDGAKLGAEIRAQANDLRAQADQDDLIDNYDSFEIIDFNRSI